MAEDWFLSDWDSALHIIVSAALVLCGTIAVIRFNGLRSLSKMSSFDFAVTVAIGSIVAATVLADSPSVLEGVVAVAALLGSQRLIALARVRFGASALVDNSPCLLMRGASIDDEALLRSRVSEDDLFAKLREANVTHLDQVHCVVLESTGDISVLHGSTQDELDERLLKGVPGAGASARSGAIDR